MTELDEPFSRVDVAFTEYIGKLIHIRGLLPRKTTEYIGQDVVWSYE